MEPVYDQLHKKFRGKDSPAEAAERSWPRPPSRAPTRTAQTPLHFMEYVRGRYARLSDMEQTAITRSSAGRHSGERTSESSCLGMKYGSSTNIQHHQNPWQAHSHNYWTVSRQRRVDPHWSVERRLSSPERWKAFLESSKDHPSSSVNMNHWNWKHKSSPNPHVPAVRFPHEMKLSGDEKIDHRRVLVAISNEESSPNDTSRHKTVEQSLPDKKDQRKRSISPSPEVSAKRVKGLDGLDLLVMASLEMAPLKENPSGCSCPKSKCVALYCECFKAGRRCDPGSCTCVNCKNTLDESGPQGARTLAMRSITARNPRAFSSNLSVTKKPLEPGQVACNCVRSRCLKLYCACFQNGKECKEGVCTCIDCLNTSGGEDRHRAIESTLQKRPDAFHTRVKQIGLGCACKNNRCIRK